ncbi:MAG: HAD family hydrolase [Candidatus Aenigmarchaeota archaeon]|nr:HAD family hydrolase [Candidatus Aenigmarchaeota archaeon]
MNKAVFLDRDGVINEEGPIEEHVFFKDLKIIAGAVEAVKAFNKMKFKVIIVSNQPAVARALCTEDDIKKTMTDIIRYFKKHGAVIDAYYYCPHHPEKKYGGNMQYRVDCSCRKPKPGMLIQAAREHNIDLKKSYMIGDTTRDIAAGKAAGCKTIVVRTEYAGNDNAADASPDFIIDLIEHAMSVIE